MPTVQYTKKRSIASGNAGDPEVIEFDVQDNERFDKPTSKELMTMGKAIAATLENILQCWKITTVPVTYSEAELAKWREFIHSCAARESFLYDPTGTESSPSSDIVTVTLAPSTWNYSRNGLGPNLMIISMEFQETAP